MLSAIFLSSCLSQQVGAVKCVRACAHVCVLTAKAKVFWNQVDLSSAGWLTVSLLLSQRGCWESSGSNPPHTTWICMPVPWVIFHRGNLTLTHTRGPSALTVCVHEWECVLREQLDDWWGLMWLPVDERSHTHRHTQTHIRRFRLHPRLRTSQIGHHHSANCFTLQLAEFEDWITL